MAINTKKYTNQSKWKTRLDTPCCLLMPCCKCQELLPITNFYIINKANSRCDILGNKRSGICISCNADSYIELDPRKKLFYGAKKRATRDGIEFTLSIEDIIIPAKCPILDIDIKMAVRGGKSAGGTNDNAPSIDRIDSRKGYTKENTRIISRRANTLKGDANYEEIMALLSYLALFEVGRGEVISNIETPLIEAPLISETALLNKQEMPD